MMKINPYHILNLSPKEGAPCLSIYANTEFELAELLERAESLGLKTYEPKVIDSLLKPIHHLHRGKYGSPLEFPLAVFSSKGFAGYSKLPFETKALSVIAASFHIKPLLKWTQREHPFSLLVLKESEAILHQGSLSYFEEIERLNYQELRSMDGVFNALDRAVYRSIQSSRVPLIIGGDIDLVETYKNVSGYRAIVDESIIDPSALKDLSKLHQEALTILTPFLEHKESAQLSAYFTAERKGRTTSVLRNVVEAAVAKKIKHLFISEKIQVWGKIDNETGEFSYSRTQTENTDDILDDLAEIVLKNNGAVTVLPTKKMPNGNAACAILSGETGILEFNLKRYENRNETWSERQLAL